ncbi:MAG: adenine phosphoribosyltransferase [Chitinophagales bacterium]|nr:adenine phosphoribosyltransferase [Bacteroidota bacterium]MCB9226810.1 adenine phosphoribosyltransferase [Chitinophagales bacterium]
MTLEKKLKSIIRDVPNFPKEGIVFKDLTTVLLNPELTNEVVDALANAIEEKPDAITAIESRGFWFGTLIAQKLGVPFIPLRKKGKLPAETERIEYNLEYGSAVIEIHKGHIQKGWKVMIHDDLLATGGTAIAAAKLIEKEGGIVHSFNFLVNLSFLGASAVINKEYPKVPVSSIVTF